MELKEYLTPLIRWWWLLLLSALIAAGASYWATRQQPPQYTSSTTLIIGSSFENPNPSQNEIYLSSTLAGTYVNLANRVSVRSDVAKALGIDWLPEVRVFQNSNTIDIYVTDTSPARAQAVAAELARQLILRSPTAAADDQRRQSFIDSQLDDYEAKILETQEQIIEKNATLPTLVSAREIANLQADIEILQGNLQRLQSNYALLLQSSSQGAINAIRVLEPATFPSTPNNPRHGITIAVAAGTGLLLAVLAAYLLVYLDDTIKLPAEASRLTGLPTLTGVANIKGEDQLVTIRQARSPWAEAFRVLRTGIQFSSVDKPPRTLLVTSSTPLDGKSTISANLAVVLAQAGNRVLLIDADLRRSSQHKIFDLSNKRGLTDLLLEFNATTWQEEAKFIVDDIAQVTRVEGLFLLASGPVPPNPSELLGSTKMHQLIELLQQQFDYIVFDSPPVLSITDSVVLSTQVDGVILVLRAEKSRRGHTKQMMQMLHDVKANLIGVVLNDLKPGHDGYGNFYYYKDPYTYGEEQVEPAASVKPQSKLRERLTRESSVRSAAGG